MPTANPVPSYDPTDLIFNAERLDEMVNSTASVYTDRRGVQRRTLAALEAEFPNAAANAAAAAELATQAANEAASAATAVGLAFNEATAAQASRVAAELARTGAESARDAAMLSAGVYATTTQGLAATTSGQYFSVPSAESAEYLILYLNNAGAAVEQKRYPSDQAVKSFNDRLKVAASPDSFLFADQRGAVAAKLLQDGTFETGQSKTKSISGSGNGDFAFALMDSQGRIAFAVYNNGRVVPWVTSSGASASGIYVVPAGSTAAEINQALIDHKFVATVPGASYSINEPIRFPSNSYFDFSYSNITLASGANCYMLVNEDQYNGNENIVIKRGRLLGNAPGQTRNYTGDYRTGYYGFGCCFTKVDNLCMDDFYVEETESWGIAYFLCGTVIFNNFDFNQGVTPGSNGDGITGIAKRIYISNVRGYTNDDMIAVGTGKSTLQGYDVGIANADNIDVDLVSVRNIVGVSKSGNKPWVGVGIYATAGKSIKNTLIDGVAGDFNIYGYRIQNYWSTNGDGYFDTVDIRNVSPIVNGDYGAVIDVTEIKTLRIESAKADSPSVSKPLLRTTNSSIQHLIVDGVEMKTNTATTGASLVSIDQRASRYTSRISIRDADVHRSDVSSANGLVSVTWASGAPELTLSVDNGFVQGASMVGRAQSVSTLLKSTNPQYEAVNYIGAQKFAESLALQNGWSVGGGTLDARIAAVIGGGEVSLNGIVQAGTLAASTSILTVSPVLRPKADQRYRLQSLSGQTSSALDLLLSTAGVLSIIQAQNVSAGDLFNISEIKFLTI